MANSFNISVKPEIAAAVVKIDANKAAIDASRTEIDSIRSNDLPGLDTKIDYVGNIVVDLHDNDIPAVNTNINDNETKIDAIQTDQFFTNILSDSIIAELDTERNTTELGYTKLKELQIFIAGFYRISMDLKGSNPGTDAFCKIYKTGVAYGTEYTNDTTSYTSHSEDLYFDRGDLIQLYCKSAHESWAAYIRNFKIKGTKSISISITKLN